MSLYVQNFTIFLTWKLIKNLTPSLYVAAAFIRINDMLNILSTLEDIAFEKVSTIFKRVEKLWVLKSLTNYVTLFLCSIRTFS
jgi:hypothetical protein